MPEERGEGLGEDAWLQISHRPTGATRTHSEREGQKRGKGAGLTVLEGAAMVSISSWVTHTLPDGYRARLGGGGGAQEAE